MDGCIHGWMFLMKTGAAHSRRNILGVDSLVPSVLVALASHKHKPEQH